MLDNIPALSKTVRKKIETFNESGMGYWLVRRAGFVTESLTGLTGLPPFPLGPLAKGDHGVLLYGAKYTVGTIPAPRELDAQ